MRKRFLTGLLFAALLTFFVPGATQAISEPEKDSNPGSSGDSAVQTGSEGPGSENRFDPVKLGVTEADLRALFGEALTSEKLERKRPLSTQIMEYTRAKKKKEILAADGKTGEAPAADSAAKKAHDPFANQIRLSRDVGGGDIQRVSYDLFRGKVYRIRWRLADRFERPVTKDFVAQAEEKFGKPHHDQTIKEKFGSTKVDRRRVAWNRGDRSLELRQLSPFSGGPVYLTRSDQKALRAIVASKGMVAPAPDSRPPWWQNPRKEVKIVTKKEREALLVAFGRILSKIDF
jgi:hypothetical protein